MTRSHFGRCARRRARIPRLAVLLCLVSAPAAGQSDMPAPIPSMPSIPDTPIRPAFIFFPPTPPALDTAIQRGATGGGNRSAAPGQLHDYVSDVFYPQLGSRIAERQFSGKLEQRALKYRHRKATLLQELRDVLAKLPPDDSEARRQTLVAFARRQTPQIIALEQTAEKLRGDLTLSERDWSSYRTWGLNDPQRRGFSPRETAQVMRAYSHFQKNVPPAHRYLLREIALELVNATDNPTNLAATRDTFFSPALARVVMPADLPDGIAAQLADFQSRKARLKKELFEAVSAYDGSIFPFLNRTLRTTIERQQKGVAELEALAEQIRPGLMPFVTNANAERSPLPIDLVSRVSDVQLGRARLQREASAKISRVAVRIRAARAGTRVNYEFHPDRLEFHVVPGNRFASDDMKADFERQLAELDKIAADYGRGLAEIVNLRDAVRAEAGAILGVTDIAKIDAALGAAIRVASLTANAAAYQDYRTAVFEPGLSPEQRRMLFEGAVAKLELPLPRGEMQPVEMSKTW